MMKLAAYIIIISLALSFSSSFSAQAAEETLFQIVSDSIEKVDISIGSKNKDVKIFNQMSQSIDTLDQASKNAKVLSLRGNPDELARRKGTR